MCIFLPCCCGRAGGLALLRCILNSAANFCLLPANLRGGRVVTGPLEVQLPAGNVVSGVYIVYALFEYKKWIFSVYIVYAFFLLSARWPARWSLRVAKNVRI